MTNESKIDWATGRTINLDSITFRKVIPVPHCQMGGGLMPDNSESYALWQFLVCAFQALEKVPAQTTLEGTEDQTADLMQIAHSCRKMYELDSLEGMFNPFLIRRAQREAARCNLPWNSKIDSFFTSGGTTLRFLDRDPDKVGQ